MSRQLFVDLDGVLADFDRHYRDLFGIDPRRVRHTKDRAELDLFWDRIRQHGDFFSGMPMMRGARRLWTYCREMHPNPIILTGVPHSIPGVEAQKRAWVARHLTPRVEVICCPSRDKCLHARPGDVLIDDLATFRDRWEAAGGIFLLFEGRVDATVREARLFFTRVFR